MPANRGSSEMPDIAPDISRLPVRRQRPAAELSAENLALINDLSELRSWAPALALMAELFAESAARSRQPVASAAFESASARAEALAAAFGSAIAAIERRMQQVKFVPETGCQPADLPLADKDGIGAEPALASAEEIGEAHGLDESAAGFSRKADRPPAAPARREPSERRGGLDQK